jgi:hypothetical protein
MTSFVSRIVILCLGVLLPLTASVAGAGTPFCTGSCPDSFLVCYSKAFVDRDSAAFATLLAPDYRCPNVRSPKHPDFDYASTLERIVRAFRSPEIQRMAIEFGKPRVVEPGETPGSWIIRDVPSTARYEATLDQGRPAPYIVRAVMSYWIRLVAKPEPHYVLFREEEHVPAGK